MTAARLSRRTALKRMAGAAAAAAAFGTELRRSPAEQHSPEAAVAVRLYDTIGTIRPAIYSQFAEHLGGVIYDGIWVGPDSKVPNVGGIRRALVEHMRRLGPVVVRWPGGCFADAYHWRDGIGPRAQRPRRFGRWKGGAEPNEFGTHEFMNFCRLSGAEPYLAANVGTGSASEFQQWVEYCNAPAGETTLAGERSANGDREPFGARYWGVGNESWGCGGHFTPEDYCGQYRKFSTWVPAYGQSLYLIASGPNGNDLDWTRRFFKKWVDGSRVPLHGWAAHYYCGTTGHALQFTEEQWYEQLDKANRMERLVADQWAAMAEFDPDHKVKLVIDEWGTWHPAGTEVNPHHLLGQMSCLRDALVAGLTLDIFNRHADKVDMANIAQLVNCLQSLFLTDGDQFVATPNFHVFEMYRPHQGARAVRLDVQAPDVAVATAGEARKLFRLAGAASVRDKDVTLTLVHTHAREPLELAIRLVGGSAGSVRHTVLTHERLNAHNTFKDPDVVVPRSAAVKGQGPAFRCVLPPASVNRLDISLA